MLLSIVFLVATIIVYSYFVSPAYSSIQGKRAEVANRESLVAQYTDYLTRIKGLADRYSTILSMQDAINTAFPPEENVPHTVRQITGLAALNRLSVEALAVDRLAVKASLQPDLVKGIGGLRITMQMSGTYDDLKTFLANVETNLNIFDVTNVRIGAGTQDTKKGGAVGSGFQYTLEMKTYYQAN